MLTMNDNKKNNECLGITVEEACKLLGIRKKSYVKISTCPWIPCNNFQKENYYK